jgi:NAD(P)H-dependent FMN reductase
VITNGKMNILGIASSMRKESTSTRALKLTLDIVKTKYDANIQVLDLKQMILPFLYYEEHNKKDEISIAEKMVKSADALFFPHPIIMVLWLDL